MPTGCARMVATPSRTSGGCPGRVRTSTDWFRTSHASSYKAQGKDGWCFDSRYSLRTRCPARGAGQRVGSPGRTQTSISGFVVPRAVHCTTRACGERWSRTSGVLRRRGGCKRTPPATGLASRECVGLRPGWCERRDSHPLDRDHTPAPRRLRTSLTSRVGSPGEIRTRTARLLRPLPLPLGYRTRLRWSPRGESNSHPPCTRGRPRHAHGRLSVGWRGRTRTAGGLEGGTAGPHLPEPWARTARLGTASSPRVSAERTAAVVLRQRLVCGWRGRTRTYIVPVNSRVPYQCRPRAMDLSSVPRGGRNPPATEAH